MQGKFLVYAKLTPEGSLGYYAAEVTLQPASSAEQTAASGKKVRDLLTELEVYCKENAVRRRYLRAPEQIVRDLAALDKAEMAMPMLLQAMEDENWDVRTGAAMGIGAAGPAGKKAVPALVKALGDENAGVAFEAMNALGSVGPAATPSLVQILRDKKASGRTRPLAARALGKIRPVNKEVISVLIEALKGSGKELNRWAAEALGEIGPVAVPSLIEILDDGKPVAKYWAAAALEQMRSAAEPAIPALIRVLKAKEKAGSGYDLTNRIALSLVHIGPAGVSQIIRILGDENEDPGVRSEVAKSLGSLPAAKTQSIGALIEAIKSRDSDVRLSAIWSLGQMGPAAKAAVPALAKALEDEKAPVRYRAADTLGAMGPAAKPALPALVRALKDTDPYVRSSATFAMGRIGLQTEEVVKSLTERLKDEDQNVRQATEEALRRVRASKTTTHLGRPAGKPQAATQPAVKWGKAVNGLQTRLTLVETTVPAGMGVRAILDVRNVSDADIEVAWCGAMGGLAQIVPVVRDGQPGAPLMPKRKVSPSKSSFVLNPNMQATVWDIRVDLDFNLSLLGTYRIQWPEIPAEYAIKGRAPPASNTVMLKITEAKAFEEAEVKWLDAHAWSEPGRDGLVSRLTAHRRRFAAGEPIRMRIEVRNTGGNAVRYYDASSYWGGDIAITGVDGRKLRWLAPPVSTQSDGPKITPGDTVILDEFDASSYCYLRKPGKYTVRYRGTASYSAIPPSPPFEIEVVSSPDAGADGDPAGRLLAALPKGWSLWGSTRAGIAYCRPGLHWSRVRGGCMRLVHSSYSPKGRPGNRGIPPIIVWLVRQRAKHVLWQASGNQWDPQQKPTTYLGAGLRWHVYVYIPSGAGKAWPTAVRDIGKALGVSTTAKTTTHAATRPSRRSATTRAFDGNPAGLTTEKLVGLLSTGGSPQRKVCGELARRWKLPAIYQDSERHHSQAVRSPNGRYVLFFHRTAFDGTGVPTYVGDRLLLVRADGKTHWDKAIRFADTPAVCDTPLVAVPEWTEAPSFIQIRLIDADGSSTGVYADDLPRSFQADWQRNRYVRPAFGVISALYLCPQTARCYLATMNSEWRKGELICLDSAARLRWRKPLGNLATASYGTIRVSANGNYIAVANTGQYPSKGFVVFGRSGRRLFGGRLGRDPSITFRSNVLVILDERGRREIDPAQGIVPGRSDQPLPAGAVLRVGPFAGANHTIPVALSPHGKMLATTDGGTAVHLWDVATGKKLRTFEGHRSAVQHLTFWPDGKRLVSGDWFGSVTVRIWDVATGKEVRKLGLGSAVRFLGVSADGRMLACAASKDIRIWDTAGWKLRRTFQHPWDAGGQLGRPRGQWLGCSAMTRDGSLIAASLDPPKDQFPPEWESNAVIVWNTGTGEERLHLAGLTAGVSLSPDGKVLAVADASGTETRLVDVATGKTCRTLGSPAGAMAFSPDGRILAMGGRSMVRLWAPGTGKKLREFRGHQDFYVDSLCFSRDGKLLASGSIDRSAIVWQVGSTHPAHAPPSPTTQPAGSPRTIDRTASLNNAPRKRKEK